MAKTQIIKIGKSNLRAIVAAGGTGGHIYPALAIAKELADNYSANILFMGAKSGYHSPIVNEKHLAQSYNFNYQGVSAISLHRSLRLPLDLIINAFGILEARKIIKEFNPHIIIGTGGYAMAPILKAAQSLKIKTLIHEQNAFPGKANLFLAKNADLVCLTFADSARHFPSHVNTSLTGLPIRQEMLTITPEQAYNYWQIPPQEQNIPTLIICGGSQGSQSLNRALIEAYPALIKANLRIIHLTGEADYQHCLKAAATHNYPHLHLLPYLKEMAYALAIANLAIGRAGASFLSEVAFYGLPSILIPYPYAANDHQNLNAQVFANHGAAHIINSSDLSPALLTEIILSIFSNKETLDEMAAKASDLSQKDALDLIVKNILQLTNGQL